jgi:hypothetical protein
MSVTKRELEAALVSASVKMSMMGEAIKAANDALNAIMSTAEVNGKCLLTDAAFVGSMESNMAIGWKCSDEALERYKLAKAETAHLFDHSPPSQPD